MFLVCWGGTLKYICIISAGQSIEFDKSLEKKL